MYHARTHGPRTPPEHPFSPTHCSTRCPVGSRRSVRPSPTPGFPRDSFLSPTPSPGVYTSSPRLLALSQSRFPSSVKSLFDRLPAVTSLTRRPLGTVSVVLLVDTPCLVLDLLTGPPSFRSGITLLTPVLHPAPPPSRLVGSLGGPDRALSTFPVLRGQVFSDISDST